MIGAVGFFVIWFGFAKNYKGGRLGSIVVGFIPALLFALAYQAIQG